MENGAEEYVIPPPMLVLMGLGFVGIVVTFLYDSPLHKWMEVRSEALRRRFAGCS